MSEKDHGTLGDTCQVPHNRLYEPVEHVRSGANATSINARCAATGVSATGLSEWRRCL